MNRVFSFVFTILMIVGSASAVSASSGQNVEDLLKEGSDLWSQNKLKEAEAVYRKAIEVDEESAAAHSALAALMVTQSRNEEAVDSYQNAIMLDPENANLFAAISIAYLHMGHHKMAQMMTARALELDPSMEHAKKINMYIDQKLKAIAEAEKAGGQAGHAEMKTSHDLIELETIKKAPSAKN